MPTEEQLVKLFDIHDHRHMKQIPVSEVAVVLRSAGLFCLQKDMETLLAGIPGVGKPNGSLGQCATGTIWSQKEVGGSLQPITDNLFANSTNPISRENFSKFIKDKNICALIAKTKGESSHSHQDGSVLTKEEQDVYNGFRAFDTKEHGYLTRTEVEAVLRSTNEKCTPDDIAVLLTNVPYFEGGNAGTAKVNINQLAKYLMRPVMEIKELTIPQTVGIANAPHGLLPASGVKSTPSI